jgi:CTP:molybdopterin cytidylyltransferase MocA
MALQGDEGGRQIIRSHPERVLPLELEEEGPLLDIDTAEDYQELLKIISEAE